ncbi:hypothetical protein A2U01_0038625, partial [Trifolium medium]|nr:hypothetical protein [Trifolium medium]
LTLQKLLSLQNLLHFRTLNFQNFSDMNYTLQHHSPSSRSSQPPSSSQGARSDARRKHELLVRTLEMAQSSSAAYLDLIKEFADCGLED